VDVGKVSILGETIVGTLPSIRSGKVPPVHFFVGPAAGMVSQGSGLSSEDLPLQYRLATDGRMRSGMTPLSAWTRRWLDKLADGELEGARVVGRGQAVLAQDGCQLQERLHGPFAVRRVIATMSAAHNPARRRPESRTPTH